MGRAFFMRFWIYILLLLPIFSFGQDLTGTWKGRIYQEPNKEYYFEIRIESLDKNGHVKGTTFIKEEVSNNFGTIVFTGDFAGSNFTFQESVVLKEDKDGKGYYPSNQFYWCIKKGTLKLSENDKQWRLTGPWTAKMLCPPGTIDVWKDKEVIQEKELSSNCDQPQDASFMLGAWKGKFKQYSCGIDDTFPMVVFITDYEGLKFEGMFIWTDMIYAEDSRSKLEGELKNGKVYFYEPSIISGSGLVLDGVYESEFESCDRICGFWSRPKHNPNVCPSMKPGMKGGDYCLDQYKIPTIFFDHSSSKLNKSEQSKLDELAQFMKSFPSLKFQVDGHTDNTGSNAFNALLSKNRAQIVVDYLVAQGIKSARFKWNYFAHTQPLNQNKSEKEKAENRRTTIQIINN